MLILRLVIVSLFSIAARHALTLFLVVGGAALALALEQVFQARFIMIETHGGFDGHRRGNLLYGMVGTHVGKGPAPALQPLDDGPYGRPGKLAGSILVAVGQDTDQHGRVCFMLQLNFEPEQAPPQGIEQGRTGIGPVLIGGEGGKQPNGLLIEERFDAQPVEGYERDELGLIGKLLLGAKNGLRDLVETRQRGGFNGFHRTAFIEHNQVIDGGGRGSVHTFGWLSGFRCWKPDTNVEQRP